MHLVVPQEITLAGAHVRTIGAGAISGLVYGIAASADMIAVSSLSKSDVSIMVFNAISGDVIRSIGKKGSALGQLDGCFGLRFTPDGGHILCAESDNNRLSLFTLTGAFVRCVGVGTLQAPSDVDFASNGDILVADTVNNRVCVFSGDGSILLRTFGSEGDAPSQFNYPHSLATHSDKVFVLDQFSGRMQVFG